MCTCDCAFFNYKRPIRLIFILEREQDCFVGRFLMHTRQTRVQGHIPLNFFLFFFSFLFFSFTGLNLKDITAKSIRSDQCLIPKQLLLLVCYLPLFHSLCVHVWKFQANNSLPSWGSLWHSSSWKSSAVKPPDLYSFLTCTSGFQHMLDLRSPTHGSRGRVIYYTPHFLSWSGEIRSKIEMG